MRSNLVGEGGAEASTETSDEVVAELGVMLARLGALAAQPTVGDDVDDAARIDRIALLGAAAGRAGRRAAHRDGGVRTIPGGGPHRRR